MPISWITGTDSLECWEVPHSAIEQHGADKSTASVQLMCNWEDRHDVFENILLSGLLWPYREAYGMRAVSGAIGSFNGEKSTEDGQGNAFELAMLTVNFETAEVSETEGLQLFTESIEPTAEHMTLPHTPFYWESPGTDTPHDPLTQAEAPGRLELGLDYCVTFYNLETIPAAAMTLAGRCNHATVSSALLGLSFAAETLLFNPPKINRNVTLGESNRYTMQARYTWKPPGWNVFWRTKTQQYESMLVREDDGVTYTPYKNFPPADFSSMVP